MAKRVMPMQLALGEADETWPRIVEDAARGQLKEIYTATEASGEDRKPTLQDYPVIPWDSLDLRQFNRIPGFVRPLMRRLGYAWETFHIIPIEIRTRLSLWMRVLHGHGILRRLDPLPIEPERRQRDAQTQAARPRHQGPGRRILRR